MKQYLPILVLLIACKKNSQEVIVRSSYIPISIGNTWKYEEAKNGVHYTVETTVLKEDRIQNKPAAALLNKTYHGPSFLTDTIWLSNEMNDLIFHANNATKDEYFRLQEPLFIGKKWTAPMSTMLSEVTVIEKINLDVKAGSFKDVFKVEQVVNFPSPWTGYTKFTYWIKPGIGIIKQANESNNSFGIVTITKVLVEYKLR